MTNILGAIPEDADEKILSVLHDFIQRGCPAFLAQPAETEIQKILTDARSRVKRLLSSNPEITYERAVHLEAEDWLKQKIKEHWYRVYSECMIGQGKEPYKMERFAPEASSGSTPYRLFAMLQELGIGIGDRITTGGERVFTVIGIQVNGRMLLQGPDGRITRRLHPAGCQKVP